jgi:OmpA-OmpF porin, OOP family
VPLVALSVIAVAALGYGIVSRSAQDDPSTNASATVAAAPKPPASVAAAVDPAHPIAGEATTEPLGSAAAPARSTTSAVAAAPALAAAAEPGVGTHKEPLLVRDFPLAFRKNGGGPILTSYQTLQELVAELQRQPDAVIELVGHSSKDGDRDTDVDVVFGRVRAEAAKAVLVGQGINAERIKISSAGSSEPIAPNDTEANRRRNRRVVLKMYAR